ncbi:hypothetical protein EB1_06420 [Empedobacter brevis NBRC 14943 = ATCC 43319]|uniref:Uncharacterized protein n=1 Tax=Empedobacter brevis NBRC 14943 = ATCC 43319 TaxID=1218108 RepID=A0A511NDG5_9FLAO|nr:hypothetical protein EB1_06420 [Empedobacter brevis NBRC 14943 = ATCC 43319]
MVNDEEYNFEQAYEKQNNKQEQVVSQNKVPPKTSGYASLQFSFEKNIPNPVTSNR